MDLLHDPDAWSAIAGAYEDHGKPLLTPFSQEALRRAALRADDDVLDVACGPGTTALLAAPTVRSVMAVDFAPDMIAILRERARHIEHLTAVVGDGQALAFDDGSFSAAFSMFGLMFFPNPAAGLRELHRVLREGGRVLLGTWFPAPQSPYMQPLLKALAHAMPPDPDAPPPAPLPFGSPEELEAGLTGAGFTDVEVYEYAPVQPIESAEHYWATARENIFLSHLRSTSGERWPDLEHRIKAHLAESLAGVTGLAMRALIGRGVKPGPPASDG